VVTPVAGAVGMVRFPFSDLSQAKLRPAVVLADAGRGDWIWQLPGGHVAGIQCIRSFDKCCWPAYQGL
jgi:hypothetical protein